MFPISSVIPHKLLYKTILYILLGDVLRDGPIIRKDFKILTR